MKIQNNVIKGAAGALLALALQGCATTPTQTEPPKKSYGSGVYMGFKSVNGEWRFEAFTNQNRYVYQLKSKVGY